MRQLAVLLVMLLLAPTVTAAVQNAVDDAPADASTVSSDLGAATVYPTYPVLTAEMQSLAAEYKDIARLHSAGQSTKGMDLWYMEIADFENPDRVPLEEREVLYIDGGTHANEYIGVIFVMHVMRSLLTGYGENDTATWIVENRHTVILPLVNPEGSMNGVGRLNDNLVNINRNFPVGWYDVDETPVVNNPGPYPASEPETRAVMGVWEKFDPDFILSIHCCGNLWLYPYGIEGRSAHVDDRQVFDRICDEVLYDVREDCGETWSTIYPASGVTSDAGYELTGANSWTYEMKRSSADEDILAAYPWFWGPPAYTAPIEELQKESWRAVMHAFLTVDKYGAHPVATLESIDADGITVRVTNDGWGNLSTATVRVVDATGEVEEAVVPRLEAGASTLVTIEADLAPGTFPVTVEYAKRPLDTKVGVTKLSLAVQAAGDGLTGTLEAVTGGIDLDPASIKAAAGEEGGLNFAPTPWGAALVALGAVAMALRRRQ